MASRWRCPPETLVPPCVMGESAPSGICETNSSDCETRSARSTSSSVTSTSAKATFEATVPEKSLPCWGTYPTRERRSERDMRRTSTPSSETEPSVTS